jgi:murein DD-endopeptidase MepM/ murein hydrolase activator NlpD
MTRVNLRAAAGREQPLLAEMRAGTMVYAVGGLAQADGLTWMRVAAPGVDGVWRAGWAAGSVDGVALLSGWEPPVALAYPLTTVWPVSQLFGENPARYAFLSFWGHNGLDFGTPVGTPVVAVDDGLVTHARNDHGGYGVYVRLDHDWGITICGHLSAARVVEGQRVARGQVIGLSGNSGNSDGPHLHFDVRLYPVDDLNGFGGRIDPLALLPADKLRLMGYAPAELRQVLEKAGN